MMRMDGNGFLFVTNQIFQDQVIGVTVKKGKKEVLVTKDEEMER